MSTFKGRLDEKSDIPTPNQLGKMESSARQSSEQLKIPEKRDDFASEMAGSFPGGFTHRDEANALIAMAVRNGPLEKLHAGKYSEWLEDESLSRLTDDEMRILMINATRVLAMLLKMRDQAPDVYRQYIQSYGRSYCALWERQV